MLARSSWRNSNNVRWIVRIGAFCATTMVLVYKQHLMIFAQNKGDGDNTTASLQLHGKEESLKLENAVVSPLGVEVEKRRPKDNEAAAAVGATTKVKWIHDVAWFQNEVNKGCCPHAKQVYYERYANIEFRCCTSKLSRGEIDPLRAVGGVDYSQIFQRNTTIYIQGDSLAEQHFVGMVCYAWSSGLTVDMKRLSSEQGANAGTIWQANITENDSTNQFTIHYLRWNQPTVPPRDIIDFKLLGRPNFIFLGGWHHGLSDNHSITKFLDQMSSHGINGHGNENVFVVDALPGHFVGGKYLPDEKLYPPNGNGTGVCEQYNSKGDPDINDNLVDIIEKKRNESETNNNITLLRVSQLYHHRGNAHVERQNDQRDCLHWCIAPGVMDALTRMTLGASHDRMSWFD